MEIEKQAEILESIGFTVPSEIVTRMKKEDAKQKIEDFKYANLSPFVHMLIEVGKGKVDYKKLTFTPTSDQIIVFAAEIFHIELTIKTILKGVETLVGGLITFGDIECEQIDDEESYDYTWVIRFTVNGIKKSLTLSGMEVEWITDDLLKSIFRTIKGIKLEKGLYILVLGLGEGCGIMYEEESVMKKIHITTGLDCIDVNAIYLSD